MRVCACVQSDAGFSCMYSNSGLTCAYACMHVCICNPVIQPPLIYVYGHSDKGGFLWVQKGLPPLSGRGYVAQQRGDPCGDPRAPCYPGGPPGTWASLQGTRTTWHPPQKVPTCAAGSSCKIKAKLQTASQALAARHKISRDHVDCSTHVTCDPPAGQKPDSFTRYHVITWTAAHVTM